MQSRKVGPEAYNPDGTLKKPSRKPTSYDEVTAIRRDEDMRREIDRRVRAGAIGAADVAATIPGVLPWASTSSVLASEAWKAFAPAGSMYHTDGTLWDKTGNFARGAAGAAIADRVAKRTGSSVTGFLAGSSVTGGIPDMLKKDMSVPARRSSVQTTDPKRIIPRRSSVLNLSNRFSSARPVSARRR